jgi:peptidoglycan/LPS O-acetylase OafA/YrhL
LIDSNPKPLTSVKLSPLGHIRELDGLRGIAVLLVVFHHLTLDPGMSNGSPIQVVAHRIFQYGNAGVDVFFVLSGFLISSLLICDRQSPTYYQNFTGSASCVSFRSIF